MGRSLTPKEYKDIMEKHGLDKNKFLTYEDFRLLFRDL
jgi:hypothetical protein